MMLLTSLLGEAATTSCFGSLAVVISEFRWSPAGTASTQPHP